MGTRSREGDPLREQLDELAGAVRGTGEMQVDVAAGLRAMIVVRAAVESAAQRGAPVDVRHLLGDAGATETEIDVLTGTTY